MNNRCLKIGLWCVPIVVFGLLLWHYLVPSGQRVVNVVVGQTSPFLQRLLPDERVGAVAGHGAQASETLLDEPVYFSVTPPSGDFDSVKVTVAFDPGGTPTFELGGLQDVSAQAFDFRPLSNTLLEELHWTRHDLNSELTVFARDPESQAWKTFLETPPDRTQVATYRAPFPTPFRLPDYQPLGAHQKFDVSLRGPHELLTYIKAEDFYFKVSYTDVNRTYGSDDGFARVYDENGNLMTEFVLRDDGNIYDNQVPSEKTSFTLSGRGWPEGVYRIVLSGTSDIIWRSLETSQRYLVAKNQVFIGDDVGYLPEPQATSLFTDAERVTFETQHQEGLQTLSVGGAPVRLDAVGSKYAQVVPGTGVAELKSPVGDVKVTGEGKYAFSRQAFFDPDPVPVTAFSDLEDSGVNYVLADLAPVQSVNGWRVAGAEFQTRQLAMENGAYKFALSAPGIHDNLGQVSIHSIQVTFMKPSLTPSELGRELRHFVKLLLP